MIIIQEKRKQKLAEEAEETAKEVLPAAPSKSVQPTSTKKQQQQQQQQKPLKAASASSSSSSSSSASGQPESDQLASVLADASPLDDHAIAAVAALLRLAPSEQQAAAFTRLLPAMHRTSLEKEMGSLKGEMIVFLNCQFLFVYCDDELEKFIVHFCSVAFHLPELARA
jgi:hypothetical protein